MILYRYTFPWTNILVYAIIYNYDSNKTNYRMNEVFHFLKIYNLFFFFFLTTTITSLSSRRKKGRENRKGVASSGNVEM